MKNRIVDDALLVFERWMKRFATQMGQRDDLMAVYMYKAGMRAGRKPNSKRGK